MAELTEWQRRRGVPEPKPKKAEKPKAKPKSDK